MRIREENCNMVLLAVVTLFAVVVAGGATLVGLDRQQAGPPRRSNNRAGADSALAQPRSADQPIIYVSDQPQVRMIGAPFVPNTNPRER